MRQTNIFEPHREETVSLLHSGPATSRAAADSMSAKAGTQRARVLAYLIEQRGFGATDQEIGDHLGIAGDSVRPRRGELVTAGLICKTTETRETPSGRQAAVYRAFTKGTDIAGPPDRRSE